MIIRVSHARYNLIDQTLLLQLVSCRYHKVTRYYIFAHGEDIMGHKRVLSLVGYSSYVTSDVVFCIELGLHMEILTG